MAKFDPTGATLLYSTYLGGNQRDFASGVAVGRDGSIYVAGMIVTVKGFVPGVSSAGTWKLTWYRPG